MRSGATKKAAARAVLTPEEAKQVSFLDFLSMYNVERGWVTPAFHVEMANWFESTQDESERLLMVFREGGKSWLVCFYVAWRLFRDPNDTFTVISARQDLANTNAGYIRDIITSHALCAHLVPTDKAKWQAQSFNVNRPFKQRNYSVQALSLSGDVTGSHSTLAILDDTETQRNSETEESRQLVRKRLDEVHSIARQILWVGTPHAGDDSIYKAMAADPLNYHPLIIPIQTETIDEAGSATINFTWPEKFPEEECKRLQSKGEARWRSQYLLEFIGLNQGGLELEFTETYAHDIVRSTSRQWHSSTERVSAVIGNHSIVSLLGSWDPAGGRNDDSVFAILARSNKDATFVHRAIKLSPIDATGWQKQTDEIIRHMRDHGVTKIVVETNTNPALPAELRMAADRADYSIQVVGVHNTLKKEQRVRLSLENAISARKLYIHQSVLQTKFAGQCRDFPANMRGKQQNDFLDAVAFGVLHLTKISPGVMFDGLPNYGRAQSSSYVAPGQAGTGSIRRMVART